MLVKQDQISPCEIELEFEIEAEKVASTFDEVYDELGKNVSVPGFRKGKAPREILRNFLDPDKVRHSVADKLVSRAYDEALVETKIKPFRPADVELIKFELGSPMMFKVKVPLAPKVELGEYIGLEVERKVPPVTDEDVEKAISKLIDRHTPYEQVTDREVREGDLVLVELKTEDLPDMGSTRNVVKVGKNLPDFDRGVLGMRIGEQKAITVTYPDDFDDEGLRGQTVTFMTTIHGIQARELPELTDEWVKQKLSSESRGDSESGQESIDTVDKLRSFIRSLLEKDAQAYADEAVEAEIIEKVISGSKVCFPEVLVEEAVEDRLAEICEILKERKITLDEYLRRTERTLDQLRESLAEDFRKSLTATLVFREIMDRENIKVEDEDIESEIRKMAQERQVPFETMKAYIESTGSKDAVVARVRRKKVVDFLVHASNIKNVSN